MYYLYVLTMYICLLFLPAYKSCTSPFVMGINSFIHMHGKRISVIKIMKICFISSGNFKYMEHPGYN